MNCWCGAEGIRTVDKFSYCYPHGLEAKRKVRWLKNQQDKSSLTHENLKMWLRGIGDPTALNFRMEYKPGLNDIETSINLSYQGSDSGAY